MIVVLWCLTVIVSLLVKVNLKFKTLNLLAKKGYKFKDFKFFEINDLIILLPIINVVLVNFDKKINKEDLVKLTDEELRVCRDNKSILTILKTNLSKEVSSITLLSYMENGNPNEIQFFYRDGEYVIVSTKGMISLYSKKEQYKRLKREMLEIENHFSTNFY